MNKPIHPLRRWLFENQVTLAVFGAQHDISRSALSEYMTGRRTPSMPVMIRIRDATGGAVQPNDFAPPMTAPLAAKPRKRRAAGATP